MIRHETPDGTRLEFLTNELDLAPGVVAFLFLRRWDEEKCFDTWKNDFASGKAWSKSVCGITNQTWLAIMTSLLLLMFVHHHQDRWQIGAGLLQKLEGGPAHSLAHFLLPRCIENQPTSDTLPKTLLF